jgi:hypothetical protein
MREEPDQDDPRMQQALRQLEFRLSCYRGLEFNLSCVESMLSIVKAHRQQWKLEGLNFPELVAIIVPRLGIFDLKRADLTPESIAMSLVNFVRDTPAATMQEVMDAFSRAYGCQVHVDDMRAGIAKVRGDMARRAARHAAVDEYVGRH